MRTRIRVLAMLGMLGCAGTSGTSTDPVEVIEAPAPRLSESAPVSTCALGRMPASDSPTVNVDVVANVVVRTADEARASIARRSPPGTDPDALFVVAQAHTDLYRLENDTQVLQEAIRTWATLVQNAPSYPQMDQVLYQLAWGLTAMDQHDRARQVYHRLIQQYPGSPLIVVAYIQFGDFYLREGDGSASRRFYERAREMVTAEDALMNAYLAYAYAWASNVAGESVDPQTLDQARGGANEALLEAIETDWCER